MTDIEISRALALAIGWTKDHFMFDCDECVIDQGDDYRGNPSWRVFDYRDWNVIGPIAERYDAFPMYADSRPGNWITRLRNQGHQIDFTYADTPQKAIAMSVIEGAMK